MKSSWNVDVKVFVQNGPTIKYFINSKEINSIEIQYLHSPEKKERKKKLNKWN